MGFAQSWDSAVVIFVTCSDCNTAETMLSLLLLIFVDAVGI